MAGRSLRSRLDDPRRRSGESLEATAGTDVGASGDVDDLAQAVDESLHTSAPPTEPLALLPAAETPAATPAATPTAMRDPWPSRGLLLLLGLVVTPATLSMAMVTLNPSTGVADYWAVSSAVAVALTPWWRGSRPSAGMWWALAAIVGVTAAWAVLRWDLGWSGVWVVTANALVAALLLGLYRAGLPHDSWAPHTPLQLVGLFAACVTSAVAAVMVAGFPGLGVERVGTDHAVAWATRDLVSVWVGTSTLFMLIYWRREPVLRRPPPVAAAFVLLLGFACMYSSRVAEDLPVAWITLVPALWAGMQLPPRGAAAYAVLTPFASSVAAIVHPQLTYYDGSVVSSSFVDLLLTFSAFLALLLSLFRDQRARLLRTIDEQRRVDEDTADLLEAVFDSMSDGFLLANPRGGIDMHNPAARRMLGRPVPEQIPASWSDYFGIRTADGARAVSDEELPLFFEPGRTSIDPQDFTITNSEGDQRVVAASAHLLTSQYGPRILLLFHDVTAEHARYRELRGFAGTVAHDLKGPLTALSGWVEAADDELAADDAQAGRDALARARQASRRMSQLIDDYLAFTVTREGLLRLGEVPLADLVHEVTETYSGADLRAPTFDIEVAHVSRADRTLTRQLLANLVGNAVKYARPSEAPYVSLRSLDDTEPGWVQVIVADRGVGIQPGDEERIFAAFSRSDKDASSYEGTGLGLALCHSIVVRHGGRIMAESNEYGGATFRFTLPQA